MTQKQIDDIKFTLNRILGNLKTEMGLELNNIRHNVENNVASTDYQVEGEATFSGCTYATFLSTRVADDGQMETSINVRKRAENSKEQVILDMTIKQANPAVVGDVAINAIRAALTRDANTRKLPEEHN